MNGNCNVIKDGVKIFTNFADIYVDKINDTIKAEEFFNAFMNTTGGQVILDFLDADNDDHIEKISIDHTEGFLKICTRIPENDPELSQMRKMAMPFDTYSILVRFKQVSFVRLKDRKCIAIVVDGYTVNRKQIRKYAENDGSKIISSEEKSSFFSTNLVCNKDGLYEYMRAMKTPISSFWIIPKGLLLSAQDSEHLLYLYNVESLKKRLDDIISKFNYQFGKTKDKEEIEGFVKMYGNQLRTVAEALFKLIMCFYHEKFALKKKDVEYNNMLLADMTKPLKKYVYTSDEDKKHIEIIARVANELSHDTGLPVDVGDFWEMYLWLKYYVEDFRIKIDQHDNEKDIPVSTKHVPYDFVGANIKSWDFSSLIKDIDKELPSNCTFFLKLKSEQFSADWPPKDGEYLCKDGKVKTLSNDDLTDALTIPSREAFVKLERSIYDCIKEKCEKAGFNTEISVVYISATYHQCGKPKHLFNLDEITKLMREANDDVNNKLVIDENGYACLIQEIRQGVLYPVSIETWCAGNHYVGKDTSLDDAEPSYRLCLSLWLRFLQTGRRQYGDCYVEIDEEKVVDAIKQFY